jgi:hypothetical protein
MCNLYKMDKSAAEVARLFNAMSAEPGNARPKSIPAIPAMSLPKGVSAK